MKAKRLEIGGGKHRMNTRKRHRLFGVDRLNPRMGIGRADKIAKQHAGKFQVIDVVALALGETSVFDPLARGAQAVQRGNAVFLRRGCFVHYADSFISLIFAAAARMAFTMF